MRRFVATAVAVLATSAVVLSSVTTAAAAPAAAPELPSVVVAGTIGHRVSQPGTVPVIDSEIGRGSALSTTPGSTVGLGSAVTGFGSALVRISALSAPAATTVYRSGGVPALEVAAATSASTTLLLPVHDGAVQLWADQPVAVRVDVLAGFESNPSLPGSMIALDAPVLRADTAAGLAASAVGADEVTVGAVGLGGVPSENVRAVYATLVVNTDRATTIAIGGQRLPIPTGRTALTTIAPLDENGAVGVSSSESQAQLQLFVSGWIPDAPDQSSQLNLPGSFVSTADATDGATTTVREGQPLEAHLARTTDAEYTIGLVSATAMVTAKGAPETTFLDLGPDYRGRGRGAVVDRGAGAIPQLMLTAADSDSAFLTLRRGEAEVSWAPVGDILGAEQSRPHDAAPTISIDSHDDGHDIDLGDHGYFTLSGDLTTPGSAVDRVEVSGPDGLIGTADVRTDAAGSHWEFDASAPRDGSFRYTATVFDRADHSASDDVTIDVEAVDPDDTVTSPETHVFNRDPAQQTLHKVSDTELTLDVEPTFAPGDVVVGAESTATPDGVFVKVVAIDRAGAGWRIQVEPATVQDAFFQVDIDEVQALDDPAELAAEDDPAALPEPTDASGQPDPYTPVEYGDGEGERTWIVPSDQVDLSDLPAEDGPTATPATLTTAAPPTLSASLGIQANLLVEWKSKLGLPTVQEVSKKAKTPEEAEAVLNSQYKDDIDTDTAAIALALKAQASVDLTFAMHVHFTWEWGFHPPAVHLDELTVKLVATLKGSAQVKFSVGTKREFGTWNALGGYKLPTVSFFAGPVPVVITNDVGVSLRSSFGLEAKLTLPELSFKRVYTYGFTYTEADGYKTLTKEPENTAKLSLLDGFGGTDFSATGSMSYGPVLAVTSKLYDVAGPEISLSGLLKVDLTVGVEVATAIPTVPEHTRAYVQFKLAVVAELAGKMKLSIWGKELGKVTLFTLKGEFPIYAGKWTTDDSKPPPKPAPLTGAGAGGAGAGSGGGQPGSPFSSLVGGSRGQPAVRAV